MVKMSDDKVPIRFLVDPETKEEAMAKLDHGGMSRGLRQRVERIADSGKSRKERLEDELQDTREEREDKVADRDKLNTDIERLNSKIERLEKELDEIRDRQGEYEGHLQSIETMLHEENARVFEGHGQITTAAEAGDCEPADVIADLKERNPNLPNHRFTPGA